MQYHEQNLTASIAEARTLGSDKSANVALLLVVHAIPPHPDNRVHILYRDHTNTRKSQPARRTATDDDKDIFEAVVPSLKPGAPVELLPVLKNRGRQVPLDTTNATYNAVLLSEIHDQHAAGKTHNDEGAAPADASQFAEPVFPLQYEYIGHVDAQLKSSPSVIGSTPAGFKIDWFIKGGWIQGPRLNAHIESEGGDWMTIRTDGIGELGIRAVFRQDDGALLNMYMPGKFDLGPDGYQNFKDGKYPPYPPVRGAPNFIASDKSLEWINRLQCFAVGHVDMAELLVTYDVYALTT